MVASCLATAPAGEPLAAAAAATVGSRALENISILSRAWRPRPMREFASATATAVMARAPTMVVTSTSWFSPAGAAIPWATPHSSTVTSSSTPLRRALRTTPLIWSLPVSRM